MQRCSLCCRLERRLQAFKRQPLTLPPVLTAPRSRSSFAAAAGRTAFPCSACWEPAFS
jgi:hypothetical protein